MGQSSPPEAHGELRFGAHIQVKHEEFRAFASGHGVWCFRSPGSSRHSSRQPSLGPTLIPNRALAHHHRHRHHPLAHSPSLSALLRNALHRVLETTLRNRSERRKRKTCAGLESNPRPLAHAPAPDAFAAARGARSTRSLAPSPPLRSLISSIQTRKYLMVMFATFPRTTRSSVDEGPQSCGDGGEDEGSVGEGGR